MSAALDAAADERGEPQVKTPFNSWRGNSRPPFWLMNGIHERELAESFAAEHRRRLGMSPKEGE